MNLPVLKTQEEREAYIAQHVIPRINALTNSQIEEIVLTPRQDIERELTSEAAVVVMEAGRLNELISYQKMIRDAVMNSREIYRAQLAAELQCVATSIVLSDLVGETFIGGEEAYSYQGVPIVVTDEMLEASARGFVAAP
jgi:hypothetical protein